MKGGRRGDEDEEPAAAEEEKEEPRRLPGKKGKRADEALGELEGVEGERVKQKRKEMKSYEEDDSFSEGEEAVVPVSREEEKLEHEEEKGT